METLVIKTHDKQDAIKQINKFRLVNKNKWYQVELTYLPFVYKIKAYNTWIQLMYQTKDGKRLYNFSGLMDISVTAFKNHLVEYIR